MGIKNITTDYTGRKKDINIAYRLNPSQGSQTVDLRFGKISSFVAGPQKLIQRYMVSLLTALGSQPGYASFGTSLLPAIQNGKFSTAQDLKSLFNFTNWEVVSAFRKYQGAHTGLPLDEQLDTAVLKDLVYDKPKRSVNLKIQIVTLAGDDVAFLLPLPIVR